MHVRNVRIVYVRVAWRQKSQRARKASGSFPSRGRAGLASSDAAGGKECGLGAGQVCTTCGEHRTHICPFKAKSSLKTAVQTQHKLRKACCTLNHIFNQ